jgi:hypothetical protein
MWPLLQHRVSELGEVEVSKWRLLYFLYQDSSQRTLEPDPRWLGTKKHLWPLFSYWHHPEHGRQFQMISPIEPLLPSNEVMRRQYSPLFSVFRYSSASDGDKDLSLLFSLIHYEKRDSGRRLEIGPLIGCERADRGSRIHLLKGLLGWERTQEGQHRLRLFWFRVPLNRKPAEAKTNP